jgi:hypothetical protein
MHNTPGAKWVSNGAAIQNERPATLASSTIRVNHSVAAATPST